MVFPKISSQFLTFSLKGGKDADLDADLVIRVFICYLENLCFLII